MEYFPEGVKVIYHSKDGKDNKTYNALEWLAAMGTHVPLRGEQVVRYYGITRTAQYPNHPNLFRQSRYLSIPFPPFIIL
jgi:hypothetical protein